MNILAEGLHLADFPVYVPIMATAPEPANCLRGPVIPGPFPNLRKFRYIVRRARRRRAAWRRMPASSLAGHTIKTTDMETLKHDELLALKGGKNEVTEYTLVGSTLSVDPLTGEEKTAPDAPEPEDDIF